MTGLVNGNSEQLQIMNAAAAILREDDRVVAVLVGGSIGAGNSDRWSDIDFRVVVEDDSFDPYLDDEEETLKTISPILGLDVRRMFDGDSFRLVVFEGVLRADFLVTKRSNAIGRPGERVKILFDRDGTASEIERLPIPPPIPPDAALARVGADVATTKDYCERAMEIGSPLGVFEAQVRLFRAWERMQLFLIDPAIGGRPAPKAHADIIGAIDMDGLFAAVIHLKEPSQQGLTDAYLAATALVDPAMDECERRFGISRPSSAGENVTPPGLMNGPMRGSLPALFSILLHAPVEAAYINRGLFPGFMMGSQLILRATVDLMFAAAHDRFDHGPDWPEMEIAENDKATIDGALVQYAAGTRESLIAGNTDAFDAFGRVGRDAANRHGVDYPERLEAAVFNYLKREGARN